MAGFYFNYFYTAVIVTAESKNQFSLLKQKSRFFKNNKSPFKLVFKHLRWVSYCDLFSYFKDIEISLDDIDCWLIDACKGYPNFSKFLNFKKISFVDILTHYAKNAPFHKVAQELAQYFHSGQLYGDQPYVEGHLKKVAGLLINPTEEEYTAALLHDVLEYTACSYETLKGIFGENIAQIILELTRYYEQPYMEYIKSFKYSTIEALKIKIADVTVNIEKCLEDPEINTKRLNRYNKAIVKLESFLKERNEKEI